MANDINITKQDTENIKVTVTDENGDAFDLTGKTVKFSIKRCASDSTYILQKTVTSHLSPTQGITVIQLSSTETNITQGIYAYDIEVTWGNNVKTVVKDIFTVTEDITDN